MLHHVKGVELTGAWAADPDRCDRVFTHRGRSRDIGFAQYPGIHGGGFIIDADRVRGKHATCKVEARKQDGDNVNVIASCATDIMYSNVQFILKMIDDDTVVRVFPGMDGMDVRYHRCRL
jgi:hypothetical protein